MKWYNLSLIFDRILVISSCGNLESLPHLSATLKALVISDCERLDLMASPEGIRGLRSFSISKISNLEALPYWLQDSKTTLQSICIKNCVHLKALPEWLQSLVMLKQLVIESCPLLLAFPEGMHQLVALKELKINDCSNLSESCRRKEGQDWSKIARVTKITIDGEIIASNDD